MCNGLLPDSVNVILDDFECALSLPLLLLVCYLTATMAMPVFSQIYCTGQSYCNAPPMKRKSKSKTKSRGGSCAPKKNKSLLNRITGMVGLSSSPDSDSAPSSPYHDARGTDSRAWSVATEIYDDDD